MTEEKTTEVNKKQGTAKQAKKTATATPSLSEIFASDNPPKMPDTVPKLVKIAVSRTPDMLKPTVAQAIFPALASYPVGLSFEYIDGQERELRINCLIIAESSGGKDTPAQAPEAHPGRDEAY